jgi:pimeloyl-ACP methyl ester carboxylesterase
VKSSGQVPGDAELAASLDGDFRSEYGEVNGIRLHYVAGGEGPPLVLLPGWPETWWEFRKIMPRLAARYRVIAVDIRGMGGSSRPESGFEKKSMASDIRELARSLGYEKISIVGHGIGAMVAYAYAAVFPDATERLVILNTTHIDESYHEFRIMPRPGDPPPYRWWLGFNLVPDFPVRVLAGNYRPMIDYMFDLSLVNPDAVTDRDRDIYARAYSAPEAIRASQGWFQAYQQDIADFNGYEKIDVPTLGLAYGPFFDYMKRVLPARGTNVQVREITGSRNYMAEEQPEAVVRAILDFSG